MEEPSVMIVFEVSSSGRIFVWRKQTIHDIKDKTLSLYLKEKSMSVSRYMEKFTGDPYYFFPEEFIFPKEDSS